MNPDFGGPVLDPHCILVPTIWMVDMFSVGYSDLCAWINRIMVSKSVCSGDPKTGQQLVYLLWSNAVWVGRFCMGDDQLAGPYTHDVGIANSIGAL